MRETGAPTVTPRSLEFYNRSQALDRNFSTALGSRYVPAPGANQARTLTGGRDAASADAAMLQTAARQTGFTTRRTYDRLGIAGVGTPAELSAGFGLGVSSYQWTENPAVIQDLKQGKTNLYGADLAAAATANYINNFGLPTFFTPYVQNRLGFSKDDMLEMGYVQDPNGNFVRTGRGTPGGTTPSSGTGTSGRGRGYRSGRIPAGYGGSSMANLLNWRIGL